MPHSDLYYFSAAIVKLFLTTGLVFSIPAAFLIKFSAGRQLADNWAFLQRKEATSLPRKRMERAA
jgi:hypothetical protein